MTLKIGEIINIRGDLVHARYGGFPARPDLQLSKKGQSGIIEKIDKINDGEQDIEVYKLKGSDIWYSEQMFSNENYIKKPIVLDIIGNELIFIDRKSRKLTLKKEQISLMISVIETIEKEEDILILENDIGNIYMNKSANYEVFTEFNGKLIEILKEDIPKYKEFLTRVK